MSKRLIILIVSSVVALGLVVAAVVFQPWLLFVNVEVNDALPTAVEETTPADEPTASATPEAPAGPIELASGALISHEHETSGTVRIIENPDGTRLLTLENLATSNGPDVHVWLSAAPVVEGIDGWFAATDAAFVDLGAIKGNVGNQVYEIPAGVDVSQYPSVYLWCVQFAVSFGAATVV